MEVFLSFHFLRPAWLFLVLPTLVLWWLWRKYDDPLRGWRVQMDPDLLDMLTSERGRSSRSTVFVLIGWLLAVIIVAGPAWRPEPSPFAEDASPLIILLKAGESMEKSDLQPTRMERAQLKIVDLAEARKGQPLGLIAYAGSAHLVMPPTKDTDVVAQMASEINTEIMPEQGDRLDLAITKAGELLASQRSTGTLLIVADASDGDMAAVKKAFEKAPANPVSILSVNEVGSSEAESLRMLSKTLNAEVEQISADNNDIESFVRHAARSPRMQQAGDGESVTRWQEGGWYLVPILAGLVAVSFRRRAFTNTLENTP